MPVPSTHRLLFGQTPQLADKRIWVLSGQIDDLFFHDLLHGSVELRRTLELWGLEHGIRLTVTLDRSGGLDFTGNPDPAASQQLFEGSRPRRPARYAPRQRREGEPGKSGAVPASGAATASESAADEPDAELLRQTAAGAQQAAGGASQALLNTINRITLLLKNVELPSLVIVEDLSGLLERLAMNSSTAALESEIRSIVRNQWHHFIANGNLLVLLTRDEAPLRAILPESTFRKVSWKPLEGPGDNEILAALWRLSRRHNFDVVGGPAIAKSLVRHGNMEVALGCVMRAMCTDDVEKRELTLQKVLQMPPINEEVVEQVKREIEDLIGLGPVKQKLRQLEDRARQIRRKLEDGAAELPKETLHLVFTGRPGTGKTTVARIVARFFHALGILRRDEVRELIASTVMSSNVNETREKMQREIEAAIGGVLFIDEAHQFGDKDSMGAREAIQALVPMSWNHRHEMVIILAGYAEEMLRFFQMDQGLERRFPTYGRLDFPDYAEPELWELLLRDMRKQGYSIAQEVADRLRALLHGRMRRSTFGNAGGVENLINEILQNHASSTESESMTITASDLPLLVRRRPEILAQARRQLESMRGLTAVRAWLETMMAKIEYQMEEEEAGYGSGSINVHPGNMLFVGPPGTGKTTIGALIAQLLYGLGSIDKPAPLVVDRARLVGAFQGHSARMVRSAVEEARDGVMFIDEAYGLVNGEHDDFGKEALTQLVRELTAPDNEGTVFILAGYEHQIDELLHKNAGLTRRFSERVHFQHFSPEDCAELVGKYLQDQHYSMEDGFLEHARVLASEAQHRLGQSFGNAGWAISLAKASLNQMMKRAQQNRIAPGDPSRRRVLIADLTIADAGHGKSVHTSEKG